MNKWILSQIGTGSPLGMRYEEAPAGGGDPAPADPPADPPAGDPAPEGWNHAEGIAGEGEAPEWYKADKYATVADQAKAYKDLEGKFGSFTGAPEEYTVDVSAELQEKGVEIDIEDPVVQKAMEWAKGAGMDQQGFSDMLGFYSMGKLAEAEAWEMVKADELKALGANAQSRIDNINKWNSANCPEDMMQGAADVAQSAAAIKYMEHVIGLTRAAPINPDGEATPGGVTETELKDMQFAEDKHGNRKIQTDPAFKAEYQKKMKAFYGEGDHVQVVG